MNLKELAQDKPLLKDLKAYLTKFLELKAIEKVFDRLDVSAVAEAKEMLDGAVEQLETEFQPKPKKINLDNAR